MEDTWGYILVLKLITWGGDSRERQWAETQPDIWKTHWKMCYSWTHFFYYVTQKPSRSLFISSLSLLNGTNLAFDHWQTCSKGDGTPRSGNPSYFFPPCPLNDHWRSVNWTGVMASEFGKLRSFYWNCQFLLLLHFLILLCEQHDDGVYIYSCAGSMTATIILQNMDLQQFKMHTYFETYFLIFKKENILKKVHKEWFNVDWFIFISHLIFMFL